MEPFDIVRVIALQLWGVNLFGGKIDPENITYAINSIYRLTSHNDRTIPNPQQGGDFTISENVGLTQKLTAIMHLTQRQEN